MLELVATLSVALVAVTVGVRLAGGDLGLRTALVVLLLAPEAYWPLRRVGAEFHAAAEGVATFEQVDDAPARAPAPEPRAGRGRRRCTSRSTTSPSPTPAAVAPALDRASPRRTPRPASPRSPARPAAASRRCSRCSPACASPTAVGSPSTASPSAAPAWRAQVALLPQRPLFVAGSIADNVRLGAPDADDAAVWDGAAPGRASRSASASCRRASTPRSARTAPTLSAGERARLALARIVLSDRPWVLLDEPTAHLDALTEQVVADTLVELARDRAVVVVAHRPALVALADHVVHLAAPTVAGRPTHARPAVAASRRRPAGTRRRRTPRARTGRCRPCSAASPPPRASPSPPPRAG